jgi:beta-lactamase class C
MLKTIVRQFVVRYPILLLLLALPLSVSAQDERVFDQLFREELKLDGVPGGAYAIVRDGHIVSLGNYGVRDADRPEPVTPETVFRVASVSKTFAAQLTAMLVSEGQLSWNDGINRYLPDFRLKNPQQGSLLRIHHLLGQSTGIVPNAYDNLINANQSLDRIVPRFVELEPMCTPGSCYTYQNVLFALVGMAIEQTSQRPYDELLSERVFEPLNMANASSGIAGYQLAANRARPHVRRNRGLPWVPTEVNENYYRVSPAAGVNASAVDLGLWLLAQMGNRPDVISADQVSETTRPRVRTARDLRRRAWRDMLSDAHYGLGWRIYTVGDEQIILHSGWVRGFVAEIAWSPSRQVGLAVLLNAESPALNNITTQFWRMALAEPLMLVDQDENDVDADVPVMGGD